MGGQGLNPLSLGGSENVGAEENESTVTEHLNNSISDAKLQAAFDGLVVPVGPGLGMSDAIDPSNTTTPVQDAIDTLTGLSSSRIGEVLIPPGKITEEAPITMDEVHLRGVGGRRLINVDNPSEIKFTKTGSVDDHGLDLPDDRDNVGIFNVTLTGPGQGATAGNGIHTQSGGSFPNGWTFGDVLVQDWPGDGYKFENVLESRFGTLGARNVGGLGMNMVSMSNTNVFDVIKVYDALGGALSCKGGQVTIGGLNIGGEIGSFGGNDWAVEVGGVMIDYLNFEPTTWSGSRAVRLVSGSGGSTTKPTAIRGMKMGTTVDYVYDSRYGNHHHLGPVLNDGTINNTVVWVDNNPNGPVRYAGPLSEISMRFASSGQFVFSEEDGMYADPLNSGTVTLGGSDSPAATVAGVHGTETNRPKLQRFEPNAAGNNFDHATREYFTWDDSDGEWDLEIVWETDPGADNDPTYDYEVVTKGIGSP